MGSPRETEEYSLELILRLNGGKPRRYKMELRDADGAIPNGAIISHILKHLATVVNRDIEEELAQKGFLEDSSPSQSTTSDQVGSTPISPGT